MANNLMDAYNRVNGYTEAEAEQMERIMDEVEQIEQEMIEEILERSENIRDLQHKIYFKSSWSTKEEFEKNAFASSGERLIAASAND